MRLLYFGWVRAKTGISGEQIELPADVGDVRGLIEHLRARGGAYEAAFQNVAAIRVAVDQEMAEMDTPVDAADEVALFPPMTGG